MHDRDNLNRLPLPGVAHGIAGQVPEAIAAVQEFVMVVADAWRFAQALKGFVDAGPKALSGRRTVISDAEEDFPRVGFRLRGENKGCFTSCQTSSWRAGVPLSFRGARRRLHRRRSKLRVLLGLRRVRAST